MDNTSNHPKNLDMSEYIKKIRHIKNLVDNRLLQKRDIQDIKNTVQNILKKKEDIGHIILSLNPLFNRISEARTKTKHRS